jgi:hypothetical protein
MGIGRPLVNVGGGLGGLVDILFDSRAIDLNVVVEIELDHVLPEIYQAVKYRALRCAQLGRPLDDPAVRAVMVAWQFSRTEARLCRQNDIEFYQYRLP